MIKKSFVAALAIVASGWGAKAAIDYTLTLNNMSPEKSTNYYLVDFDTKKNIDSLVVTNGGVNAMKGSVEKPVIAVLIHRGNTDIIFIEEPGSIVFDCESKTASGTVSNDALTHAINDITALTTKYPKYETDAEQQAEFMEEIEKIYDTMSKFDNMAGDFMTLQMVSTMTYDELQEAAARRPQLAEYNAFKNALESAQIRNATMPGGKMVDFEVEYNGITERLSDYVGKGRFVLVDFWASWCGPCIRQTAVIKDLYKKYGPEGTGELDVLGVAVWDKPEDTLQAITEHELPWPCIINAQKIPTDLYGIQGIPCIILFGPDGTIISRDKQSEELIQEVSAAIEAAR